MSMSSGAGARENNHCPPHCTRRHKAKQFLVARIGVSSRVGDAALPAVFRPMQGLAIAGAVTSAAVHAEEPLAAWKARRGLQRRDACLRAAADLPRAHPPTATAWVAADLRRVITRACVGELTACRISYHSKRRQETLGWSLAQREWGHGGEAGP
jgi:hypothetical protein